MQDQDIFINMGKHRVQDVHYPPATFQASQPFMGVDHLETPFRPLTFDLVRGKADKDKLETNGDVRSPRNESLSFLADSGTKRS
jgi:hypothetical protein